MAQRPLIGVTGNSRRLSPSWWCTRIAVWLAGGRARRISVRHHPQEDLHELDGLIVGGGDDIDPALYGSEELATEEYDRDRDELESRYLRRAWESRVPVLGICRGAQLLNVIRQGNLLSDIRHMRKITSNRRRVTPCKTARVTSGSLLHRVIDREDLRINSLHHQAIDRAGDDLAVCARDDDQIVQAVCSALPEQPAIGVQWHPEYLFYRPRHFSLFRWLVQQAKQ